MILMACEPLMVSVLTTGEPDTNSVVTLTMGEGEMTSVIVSCSVVVLIDRFPEV